MKSLPNPDRSVPMLPIPNHRLIQLLAIGIVTVGVPEIASGQFGKILKRGKAKVERKIDQKVDQAMDQAIECAFDDPGCIEKAKADGKPVVMTDKSGKVMTDADGNPITDPTEARSQAEEPGTGVWRNYDFVRGDSIWVATDWSGERVGRFPASQLEFVKGNMEIVERGGTKLLEVKSASTIRIKLPAALPEQFSLEFKLEIGAPNISTAVFTDVQGGSAARFGGDYLYLYSRPGIYRKGVAVSSAQSRAMVKNLMPVRLQVDGEYAILYVGADRVGMVPNAAVPRGSTIQFNLNANPNYPAYLSDIVVAVGLDPLYDKLMADGAVTSYGFLFDVDSDRLRPESTPKLEELLKMMADHPELKVAIEGHTDATGDDGHNQELSEARARSVVEYLTSNGIDSSRLSATGMGETTPIGDNATAVGRQQNRRVVIRRET